MSNWKSSDIPMPMCILKLVELDDMSIHLRSVDEHGNFYDDNGDLDDSEMELLHWCDIPE